MTVGAARIQVYWIAKGMIEKSGDSVWEIARHAQPIASTACLHQ
jgi:hypothetical protein